jgi:serine phosphatase RsbU (regulator of sigma subunit)
MLWVLSDEFQQTLAIPRGAKPAAAQPDDLACYLVVIEGGKPGRRLLIEAEPREIGRDAARDLVLDDGQVSRLHFKVRVERGHVVVEDWQSTNGTFVNGKRLSAPRNLPEGGVIQVGHHVLKLERRSRQEVAEREALDRDLEKASGYVRSLLPEPIADGPVCTDWFLQPSTKLGGDAFGYQQIDADNFACYLMDVCGHGAGAAMHSVAVLNVLRTRALGVDLHDPAAVLAALNNMFQMDQHGGMYFTMWFGVYNLPTRTIRYSSAGHHPAYLVAADRSGLVPLCTRGLMVGAVPDAPYQTAETQVPTGACLYLFSDGVFEIVTSQGKQWRLEDLLPTLLAAPVPDESDARRIYQAVTAVARPGPLDDDFSTLSVTFS